ncbi:MAG: DUF4249 domain-containing protein [Bacteroidetes bacterium]|nr:MAG: DUF4249 domain-containing protein [Bacteroidota bacterium]
MKALKNKYIQIVLALTFLAGISACEKDVVLDLADIEGKYLIVEANLIDDGSRQWIRLTRSSSYYEVTTGNAVQQARVIVEGNDQSFEFTELYPDSLPGYYFNSQISDALIETNYELIIETTDNNIYFAQSVLRPVPVIDSVTVEINPFSEFNFFDTTIYDVIAHFADLPGKGDHYLFNLYINRKLKTPRPSDKAPMSDINLDEYSSYAVLTINENDITPGDTLTLEMRSISKENFEFYNIFFFQTDLSGNPFAGAPPANIPTNMSEGARGFFQVSAVARKSMIFEPPQQ